MPICTNQANLTLTHCRKLPPPSASIARPAKRHHILYDPLLYANGVTLFNLLRRVIAIEERRREPPTRYNRLNYLTGTDARRAHQRFNESSAPSPPIRRQRALNSFFADVQSINRLTYTKGTRPRRIGTLSLGSPATRIADPCIIYWTR